MDKSKPKKPPPKVKHVELAHHEVLRVVVPKEVTPVIATDHEKGIVEIVPVPVEKKSEGWWSYLFGD